MKVFLARYLRPFGLSNNGPPYILYVDVIATTQHQSSLDEAEEPAAVQEEGWDGQLLEQKKQVGAAEFDSVEEKQVD